MKKNALYSIRSIVVKIFLFTFVCPSTYAQVSDPSSWNSFVNSKENVIISDTFRLQTFGDSEKDNWLYTAEGKVSILDASKSGITNQGGKISMKMFLNSAIHFEHYQRSHYETVQIKVYYGGVSLISAEKLTAQVDYAGKINPITLPANTTVTEFRASLFSNNPTGISIVAAPSGTSGSKNGYHFLDYAFAFGNIPQYSLFTGTGNWNDTTRWSHLPPLRNRRALIDGDITIDTNMRSKSTALNTGSLHVTPDARFTLNNLYLYEAKGSITSESEIVINEQITYHKTFDEKGKWYFISFPFNVYPHNIDARFQQKTDAPNDGGNYFYLQHYNGEKRAQTNSSTNNWEVCPIAVLNSGTPLFEKNKGYLIALDEKATSQTLTFSSEPGEIPLDFAHKGDIPIPISAVGTGIHKDNAGWYLCGNPMPAPLRLADIAANPALDGYIYVYEDNGYKAYPITGNYALPPLAAFFVKSSSPTELTIKYTNLPKRYLLLETSYPLSSLIREPCSEANTSTTLNPISEISKSYVKDGIIYLENITDNGSVQVFDITGHCLLKQSIHRNSGTIPMRLKQGLYIVNIKAGSFEAQHKIVVYR